LIKKQTTGYAGGRLFKGGNIMATAEHAGTAHGKTEKQVAIVTGGTRGIGLGITKALARAGMRVLAVYRSREDEARKTAAECKKEGLEVEIFQADMGYKDQAEKAAQKAGALWGRIDVLVNNAGVFEFRFLEELTEEFFDGMYRSNLKSMIFAMQAVLPWMKKHSYGRIVNATSISGTLADVGLVAYACSKASVNLLTKVASGELAPYGITVNAYAPGIVHTDMTDAMIRERGDAQLKQIPAGRFGTVEDTAALVTFLCSKEAAYVTGELIGVDGGMMKVQNPTRAYDFARDFNARA
jgi:3-oxoacyl-[acyl-carrier protein] reductase